MPPSVRGDSRHRGVVSAAVGAVGAGDPVGNGGIEGGGTSGARARRRERHRATVAAGILAHARRLRWGKDRLDTERERALRVLLAFAKEHSPYHAKRLADVGPDEFTETQLSQLPVMTKQDMMVDFSEVTTDRRLTADLVDRHLGAVDQGGDDYLLDQYRAIASSGSSGLRGTYLYDWDGWTTLGLMASRSRTAMLDGSPRPPGSATVNLLGSGQTTLSSAMSSFLADPRDPSLQLPMTTPIPGMIADPRSCAARPPAGLPQRARPTGP